MPTDISEAALEILIVADIAAAEWLPGEPNGFDRACSVDLVQLSHPALLPQFLILEPLHQNAALRTEPQARRKS